MRERQDGGAAPTSDAPGAAAPAVLRVTPERWRALLMACMAILAVGAILAALEWLLQQIHHTVLIFAVASLLAYALDPVVEFARRRARGRRASRAAGVATVTLVILLALGVSVWVLGAEAAIQGRSLARQGPAIRQHALAHLHLTDLWLRHHGIPLSLAHIARHPPPSVRDWVTTATPGFVSSARRFTRSAFETFLACLVTLYLLIYGTALREGLAHRLPEWLAPHFHAWQSDANALLSGYVRGQLALAILTGVAAAVACAVLGVRFWLLIGAFVAVAALVPVFGAYVGAAPALIAAGLSPPGPLLSPVGKIVVLIVVFVALNEFGSKVLFPKLVGKALGLHEVVVLFVILAGLEVGGVWGVLFAAPVASLVLVTAAHAMDLWLGRAAGDTLGSMPPRKT
ncbi:MAG: AI-2E family transporter [Armatimonadetes bacterium]|nr:AI-2E family transporter [Armatimonadota bacterium]MDE2207498.1 AI-2E family transporter [Armatimonadota bacterium]